NPKNWKGRLLRRGNGPLSTLFLAPVLSGSSSASMFSDLTSTCIEVKTPQQSATTLLKSNTMPQFDHVDGAYHCAVFGCIAAMWRGIVFTMRDDVPQKSPFHY